MLFLDVSVTYSSEHSNRSPNNSSDPPSIPQYWQRSRTTWDKLTDLDKYTNLIRLAIGLRVSNRNRNTKKKVKIIIKFILYFCIWYKQLHTHLIIESSELTIGFETFFKNQMTLKRVTV